MAIIKDFIASNGIHVYIDDSCFAKDQAEYKRRASNNIVRIMADALIRTGRWPLKEGETLEGVLRELRIKNGYGDKDL